MDSNLAHVLWRSIFSENENCLLKKEFLSSNILINLVKSLKNNELNYLDKSMYIDLITWFLMTYYIKLIGPACLIHKKQDCH